MITTRLHRGKTLYLTPRLVELVDPLCRIEVVRAESGELGAESARVMAHLASAGQSTTDDLKVELGLEARGYQRVRRLLESKGAIVSSSIAVDGASGGHRHMSEISRWDQVVDESPLEAEEALARLLGAVVDAEVLIPETEARRALTWTVPSEALDWSIASGWVRRVSGNLLATTM